VGGVCGRQQTRVTQLARQQSVCVCLLGCCQAGRRVTVTGVDTSDLEELCVTGPLIVVPFASVSASCASIHSLQCSISTPCAAHAVQAAADPL
jgi:hypothetical protein